MTDSTEDLLRAALQSRADALDPAGVARVLARDYGTETTELSSMRGRLGDGLRSRRRLGLIPAAGVLGLLVAAAVVALVLTLGSPPAPALAEWTPAPTPPAQATQVATSLHRCPAPNPVLIDTRGPLTAVLFMRPGQLDFCITSGGSPLYEGGGSETPNTNPAPGPDGINLDDGGSTDSTGKVTVTEFYGRVGAQVTGVQINLSRGAPVTATVGHGWYLAWYPGDRRATGVTISTPSGTKTEPLNGVTPANACPGQTPTCKVPAAPTIVAPDIGTYRLFREPSARIPARLRPRGITGGVERVLDTGSRDGIEATAVLLGVTGAGTEVCVAAGLTHAPAGSPAARLSGACGGPSRTVTQTPYVAVGGAEGGPGGRPTVAAGLVPDGITHVTLLFTDHRHLTLPVIDNAIATHIRWPVTGIRWTDRTGTHTAKA